MTIKHAIAGMLAAAALVSAAAFAAEPAAPIPATPQPDPASLKDGLAVTYYSGVFNNISELVEWMRQEEGKPGAPIPMLDYQVGIGNVLTSSSDDFVGAHITGLIEFPAAGTYELQITSNDGVRVTIGGVMVFEDPTVHPDTTSPPVPVNIAVAGWYSLDILYFEKKRTSTLKLYWKGPEETRFVPVPAAALKHR